MSNQMTLLGIGVDHPDRGIMRTEPAHAVLRVATAGGSLREIPLTERQLIRLAADAVSAISILARAREEQS